MRILTRYVLREHVGPLVFALSALTALLLLNQVAKQFGNLVGKGLPWSVIGEFFFLSIPFIVAMTLPMAVLVSVLYAFSRLAAENEITAMRANGVSMTRIVWPVMGAGAVLAVVMLLFNDQVLPRSNHRLRTLQSDIARKKPTFALRPQVINEVVPAKLFLRAARIEEASNGMRDVTIYNFDDPVHRKTIYADSGTMGLTPDHRDLQMTLHDGYMQQIPRDNLDQLQRLYYRVDLVRVRGVGNKFETTEKDNYKSEREMSMCEMDSMYQQNSHELSTARRDLADLLGGAAREAATGQVPAPVPLPTLAPPRLTSGAAYCRSIRAVARVTAKVRGRPARRSTQPNAPAPARFPEEPPLARAPEVPAPMADTPRSALEALARARRQAVAEAAARKEPRPSPDMGPSRLPPSAGGSRFRPSPDIAPPAGAGDRHRPSPDIEPPKAGGNRVRPSRDAQSAKRPAPPVPKMSTPSPAFATTSQVEVARARVSDARFSTARYQVEIHKKFALAAACMVFVLFGAPVAMRYPRGGVGLVIGVSIVSFALYYVCLIAGEDLANKLIISPLVAMWAANVIFSMIGLIALVRVQRTGSTSRGGDVGELLDGARAAVARFVRRFGVQADRRRRLA